MKRRTPVGELAVHPERFLVLFFAFLVVGFGLLLAPFIHPAVAVFSHGLVMMSAALIHACGGSVVREGSILRNPVSGLGVEMQDGCNGVNVTILLWAAMLAFPASWKWEAKGIAAGTAMIQGINVVRFISLFYLRQYSALLFDFAHQYLWEALIMLDAAVIFWIWARAAFRVRDQLRRHRA